MKVKSCNIRVSERRDHVVASLQEADCGFKVLRVALPQGYSVEEHGAVGEIRLAIRAIATPKR